MPERGASTPILTGLAWAMSGAGNAPAAATAPAAVIDLSMDRREMRIERPPLHVL
jgi:hypothetical protein